MKLAELSPAWEQGPGERPGWGVSFNCPRCRAVRLVAWFRNPLDLGPPHPTAGAWHRLGDELARLTIVAPPWGGILEVRGLAGPATGHWTGHVVDGEVRDGQVGGSFDLGGVRGVRGHATGEHRVDLSACAEESA